LGDFNVDFLKKENLGHLAKALEDGGYYIEMTTDFIKSIQVYSKTRSLSSSESQQLFKNGEEKYEVKDLSFVVRRRTLENKEEKTIPEAFITKINKLNESVSARKEKIKSLKIKGPLDSQQLKALADPNIVDYGNLDKSQAQDHGPMVLITKTNLFLAWNSIKHVAPQNHFNDTNQEDIKKIYSAYDNLIFKKFAQLLKIRDGLDEDLDKLNSDEIRELVKKSISKNKTLQGTDREITQGDIEKYYNEIFESEEFADVNRCLIQPLTKPADSGKKLVADNIGTFKDRIDYLTTAFYQNFAPKVIKGQPTISPNGTGFPPFLKEGVSAYTAEELEEIQIKAMTDFVDSYHKKYPTARITFGILEGEGQKNKKEVMKKYVDDINNKVELSLKELTPDDESLYETPDYVAEESEYVSPASIPDINHEYEDMSDTNQPKPPASIPDINHEYEDMSNTNQPKPPTTYAPIINNDEHIYDEISINVDQEMIKKFEAIIKELEKRQASLLKRGHVVEDFDACIEALKTHKETYIGTANTDIETNEFKGDKDKFFTNCEATVTVKYNALMNQHRQDKGLWRSLKNLITSFLNRFRPYKTTATFEAVQEARMALDILKGEGEYSKAIKDAKPRPVVAPGVYHIPSDPQTDDNSATPSDLQTDDNYATPSDLQTDDNSATPSDLQTDESQYEPIWPNDNTRIANHVSPVSKFRDQLASIKSVASLNLTELDLRCPNGISKEELMNILNNIDPQMHNQQCPVGSIEQIANQIIGLKKITGLTFMVSQSRQDSLVKLCVKHEGKSLFTGTTTLTKIEGLFDKVLNDSNESPRLGG
jgi:hypothetical protein